MIPSAFEYMAPTTLQEALTLLSTHKDEAKVLAGGHSLLPMMKLRLAAPAYLIDLGRIPNLAYIRESGGRIQIGPLPTPDGAAGGRWDDWRCTGAQPRDHRR
jgi:aerobic carbon-monoxide dehydrogenase medium subunit